jgi:hypothetical protein
MRQTTDGRSPFSRALPCILACISVIAPAITCRTSHAEASAGSLLNGLPRDEILLLGERMYVKGVLPSGNAMQAVVKGDVPVDGTMFTCVSCHLRSGFGSTEGLVRTPPIDGARLYAPLSKFKGMPLQNRSGLLPAEDVYRPAYTDAALARVIRTGDDPAGRKIDDVMPLYLLDDRDADILVYYLKNLSRGQQPGITDTTLRFATVITDDVAREDREAMLTPLQSFIRNWRISRSMERSVRTEAFLDEGASKGIRTLSLAVWDLKGPPEGWREQLETYYRKEPVFALLGGMSTREWAPIHRFCEDHRIPAVFPITDLPVISEADWYTVYLSKGLYQEGETAARYLHGRSDLAQDTAIVQVFRKDPAGLALSKAFRETWISLGHETTDDLVVDQPATMPADLGNIPATKRQHTVVLIWLRANEFPALDNLAKARPKPDMIFASFTLLGKRSYSLPESARASIYLTFPYALPGDHQNNRTVGDATSKTTATTAGEDVGLRMRPLFSAITGPLARLRSFVYRDYFIELMERTPDQSLAHTAYPRLSFGPGQRYASKGCYIVQLSEGSAPKLLKKTDWVIH